MQCKRRVINISDKCRKRGIGTKGVLRGTVGAVMSERTRNENMLMLQFDVCKCESDCRVLKTLVVS